jgi:hypothetical protein
MDSGTDLAELLGVLDRRTYFTSVRVKVGLSRDDKGVKFIGAHATATDQPAVKTTFLDYGPLVLGEFGLSIPDFKTWISRVVKEDKGVFGDFEVLMKGQFENRADLSQQIISSNYQYFPVVWSCNVYRYNLDHTLAIQPPGSIPIKINLPLYPEGRTAISDWLGDNPGRSDFNGTLVTYLPNMAARLGEFTFSENKIGLSLVSGKASSEDMICKIFVQDAFGVAGRPQRSANMELNFLDGKAEAEITFRPGLVYATLVGDDGEVVDHQRIYATYPAVQEGEFELSSESMETIIAQGESETLEFKAEISKNRDELVETIVAFANSNGGIILLGVEDNGVIRGVPDSEVQKIEERITNLTSEYSEPPVEFKARIFKIHERNVVAVVVEKGTARPHWLKNRGPMIRRGSTDRIMNRFEAEQAFRRPGLNPFEITS